MTHPARRFGTWLVCGCLILALGGFGLAGLGTRDATANVSGIWQMTMSGMAFSTGSDMPEHYFRTEALTLFQHGYSIHGYAGGGILPPPKAGVPPPPNGFHTMYFDGFVAGNRIWLFCNNDRFKTTIPSRLSPLFITIVGRVEADETIVAEFILLEYDYGFDEKRPPAEGQGASGLFRAVKIEDLIIEPLD